MSDEIKRAFKKARRRLGRAERKLEKYTSIFNEAQADFKLKETTYLKEEEKRKTEKQKAKDTGKAKAPKQKVKTKAKQPISV